MGRLRATLPGALIVPLRLSMLASGLLTGYVYVPGTLGLVLNLICLFINRFGVTFFKLLQIRKMSEMSLVSLSLKLLRRQQGTTNNSDQE